MTLVVCLGLVGAGDRTGWSRGFGFDGRTYGDLAQHFPGAAFRHEGVTPPGYGPFTGRGPPGIDSYYARRIVPSAVVYYTLSALSLEKSPNNVVHCFSIWNAMIIALVVLLWCLIADRLSLRPSAKMLGLAGLLVNFAALKAAFYYPVLTDTFAFGFGAASIYFWLARSSWALAVTTVLGAFTWPTLLPFGAALLLFEPKRMPLKRSALSFAKEARGATSLRLMVAAAPALALLGYLIHLRAAGFQAAEGIPLGGAFALATPIAALFVFASLLWLVPEVSREQLRELGRLLLSYRALGVAAVIGLVFIGQALLADRPSTIDQAGVLRSSLWYSALDPALFLVVAVGFFGPSLVLVGLRWREVCAQVHSYGPGATIGMVLAIVSIVATEPRKMLVLYPLVVLFMVMGVRRDLSRRWFLPTFMAGSIALSRVWLPIGKFGWDTNPLSLHDFPAQRYFMSSGVWTSHEMYLVQLTAALLLAVLFAAISRQPGSAHGDRALRRRVLVSRK